MTCLVDYYDSNIGIDTVYTYCGDSYSYASESNHCGYTYELDEVTCLACFIAKIEKLEGMLDKAEEDLLEQEVEMNESDSHGSKAISIVALVLASVALLLSVISLSIGGDEPLPANNQEHIIVIPREKIGNVTILPAAQPQANICKHCNQPISDFDVLCPHCIKEPR